MWVRKIAGVQIEVKTISKYGVILNFGIIL